MILNEFLRDKTGKIIALKYRTDEGTRIVTYDEQMALYPGGDDGAEYDPIIFAFHCMLMVDVSIQDKSILDMSYACFSEQKNLKNGPKFKTYKEFIDACIVLEELTDLEKSIIIQLKSWEESTQWNME